MGVDIRLTYGEKTGRERQTRKFNRANVLKQMSSSSRTLPRKQYTENDLLWQFPKYFLIKQQVAKVRLTATRVIKTAHSNELPFGVGVGRHIPVLST